MITGTTGAVFCQSSLNRDGFSPVLRPIIEKRFDIYGQKILKIIFKYKKSAGLQILQAL